MNGVRLLAASALCLLASCDAEVLSPVDGSGAGPETTTSTSGASTTSATSAATTVGSTAQSTSASSTSSTGAGGGPDKLAVGDLVPDFSLMDTNPASPTGNQPVSPRDYLEHVSGWYFGHST